MKSFLACVAVLLALLLPSVPVAQGGKLSDQEFRKLATSHANADEHQKLAAPA